jgi:CRISPR-associated protein Cmr3
MSERLVFLEPVDVWSFRDGRPFDAGEVFEAASIFPPAPWTVLGSLRTALLRRNCPDPERYAGRPKRRDEACPVCGQGPCEATAIVGTPDGPAPFRLTPPLPGRKSVDGGIVRFFPTPADLVVTESESATQAKADKEGFVCARLAPIELPRGVAASGAPLQPVGHIGPGRVKPFPTAWLTEAELGVYLQGRAELSDWRQGRPDEWTGAQPDEEADSTTGESATSAGRRRPSPMRFPELRIGIGMDYHQNTVRTGRFYVREAVRLGEGLEDLRKEGAPLAARGWWTFGLTVTVDRPLGLEDETIRLGGDGRLARVTEAEAPPWPAGATGTRRFRLYLAAPTFLAGGHVPRFVEKDSFTGRWPGGNFTVRLCGAALAPLAVVGGWNLALQQPRPMRRLVGGGSVFYFELIDGHEDEVLRAAHGRPFCDDETMAMAGFGLAFVGEW